MNETLVVQLKKKKKRKTRVLCRKDLLGFRLLTLERVAYNVDFWVLEFWECSHCSHTKKEWFTVPRLCKQCGYLLSNSCMCWAEGAYVTGPL